MAQRILVVGANGNVGSALVPALAHRGAEVRGLVRSDEAAVKLKETRAEPVVGDLRDPGSLGPAFADIEVAVIITPGVEDQVELARNAIAAARAAGVGRLVRQSAFVPEPASETILGRQHAEVDELVKDSGLPYTIVRPTFFMQNLLASADAVGSQGQLYSAFGQGRAGIVDVRDIGDVIETVSVNEGHEGKTYTLTGPASISMDDVAQALTEAIGRDVTYVPVPPEAAVDSMVEMGVPEFVAGTYGELFKNFAAGGADRATHDVEKVTGHPARSIDDFARDFSWMFGGRHN